MLRSLVGSEMCIRDRHIQGGLFRIQSGCKVFRKDGLHAGEIIIRFGMRCQGMEIGNKEITFGLMLQLDKIPESPEVIAQMQVARGTYAAQNSFHRKEIENSTNKVSLFWVNVIFV